MRVLWIYFSILLSIPYSNGLEAACTGEMSLDFYGQCVSACPAHSAVETYGFSHPKHCACKIPDKIMNLTTNKCISGKCSGDAPLNFFGRCVDSCPPGSQQSTFGIPHYGYCICSLDKGKTFDGTGCIDEPCSKGLNFYGKCVNSCPVSSSEVTLFIKHPGYCICRPGKSVSFDGLSCVYDCAGYNSLNFYGNCVHSCPVYSSQNTYNNSHPGHCICQEGASYISTLEGHRCEKSNSNQCEEGKLNFYGVCVDACPPLSTQTNLSFCHCNRGYTKEIHGGQTCVEELKRPIPVITGGYGRFNSDTAITFSGEKTTDPNRADGSPEDLSFLWECLNKTTSGEEKHCRMKCIMPTVLPTDINYTIPSNCLDEGLYHIRFSTTAYSRNGQNITAQTRVYFHIKDVEEELKKPIVIITEGERTFMSDTPVKLSGEKTIDPNREDHSPEDLSFRWECFTKNADGREERYNLKCRFLVSISDGINYTVPASCFDEGLYYLRLYATAYDNAQNLTAHNLTYIRITYKEKEFKSPIAIIDGGNQTFRSESRISLSAENSIDPNRADGSPKDLEFLWECLRKNEGEEESCEMKCDIDSDPTDIDYIIPPNCLDEGTYFIKLSATVHLDDQKLTAVNYSAIEITEKCVGDKSKYFYGQCVANCPADADEKTLNISHNGICVCDFEKLKIWDGGENCVDIGPCKLSSNTPLNFYGKCVEKCPENASQSTFGVSHRGYCICQNGTKWDGDDTCEKININWCWGKLNFYGTCLEECPQNASPTPNGFCRCDDGYTKEIYHGQTCVEELKKPIPVITGGFQIYSSDIDISFSGEKTIDPNRADESPEDLSFLWECLNKTTSGVENHCRMKCVMPAVLPTDINYKIPSNCLDEGLYHIRFSATAHSSNGYNITAQKLVYFRIKDREEELKKPIVVIKGGNKTFMSDTTVTLSGEKTIDPNREDHSPEDLSFRWELFTKDAAGKEEIYILKCNFLVSISDGINYTVPASCFDEGLYYLRLYATAYDNAQNNLTGHNFAYIHIEEKYSLKEPTAVINGGNRTIMSDMAVELTGEDSIDPNRDDHSPEDLSFLWKCLTRDSAGKEKSCEMKCIHIMSIPTSINYTIGANCLDQGSYLIRLYVTAHDKNNNRNLTNHKQTYIAIKDREEELKKPIVVIKGGNKTFMSDTTVTLSGEKTIDPNREDHSPEDLSFRWELFTKDAAGKEEIYILKCNFLVSISDGINYTVPASCFDEGLYYLRLYATAYDNAQNNLTGHNFAYIHIEEKYSLKEPTAVINGGNRTIMSDMAVELTGEDSIDPNRDDHSPEDLSFLWKCLTRDSAGKEKSCEMKCIHIMSIPTSINYTIGANCLDQGSYLIRLYVTAHDKNNNRNLTNHKQTYIAIKDREEELKKPIVVIKGGNKTFMSDTTVTLSGEKTIDPNREDHSPEDLSFRWELFTKDAAGKEEIYILKCNFLVSISDGINYTVPASCFDEGLYYLRLYATAYDNAQNNLTGHNFAYIHIEEKYSLKEPTAVINGGNRTIMSDMAVELTGEDSIDPNRDDHSPEDLSFLWKCLTRDSAGKEKSCEMKCIHIMSIPTSINYTIGANCLDQGSYLIRLYVTAHDKNNNRNLTNHKQTYIAIKDREEELKKPIVVIKGGNKTFMSDTTVTLSGEKTIDPNREDHSPEDLSFRWELFTKDAAGKEEIYILKCNFLVSISDGINYTVPASCFDEGLYYLRLYATAYDNAQNNLTGHNFAYIHIEEKYSLKEPTAVINGGNRTIMSDMAVELTGEDSIDPNRDDHSPEDLSFLWKCLTRDSAGKEKSCEMKCIHIMSIPTSINYTIGANCLDQGSYLIRLYVTAHDKNNNRNLTNHKQTYIAIKDREEELKKPIVVIKGGNKTFMSDTTVTLSGEKTIDPNREDHSPEDLSFRWELFTKDAAGKEEIYILKCNFLVSISDGINYTVPASCFDEGLYYLRLYATAYDNAQNNLTGHNFAYIHIKNKELKLPIIDITGGNETFRSDSQIKLSAEKSIDPNREDGSPEDLDFIWQCFTRIGGVEKPCDMKCATQPPMNIKHIIPPNCLVEGIYYIKLSATVQANGLSLTAMNYTYLVIIDKCIGNSKLYFYGECVADCPTGSSEETLTTGKKGICVCEAAKGKIWDGGEGCLDMPSCVEEDSNAPIFFYGKCMQSCPHNSSLIPFGFPYLRYCLCHSDTKWDGNTACEKINNNNCSEGEVNFYGECMNTCPENSSPKEETFCECNENYKKSSNGLECELEFIPPPKLKGPRARITVEDQTVSDNKEIFLSGRESINPNQEEKSVEGLNFLWECFSSKRKAGCLTQSNSELESSKLMNYPIPPHTLPSGVYYFKLTVSLKEGELSGVSYTSISVVQPDGAPIVSIQGAALENVVNPLDHTTFKIVFKNHTLNTRKAKYNWAMVPPVSTAISSSRYFTIRKNTLTANTEYTLSCEVVLASGASTDVSTVIRPAREISIGKFFSDVKEGIGYETVFTFTAEDFSPGEGETLEYKFAMKIEGWNIVIPLTSRFTEDNSLSIDLPSGKEEHEYKVRIIVIARNVLKMEARSDLIVIVKPKEEREYSRDFVKDILDESRTQSEKILSLGMVAPLSTDGKEDITEDKKRCGKCSNKHGICDVETGECKCKEGYSPPDCTLTVQKAENNKQILRTVADSVVDLLNSELDSEESLSLLSTMAVCSAGSSMGDESTNKVLENIEDKMVEKFITGGVEISRAAPMLLTFISNSIGGLTAENAQGNLDALNERHKSRMKNLKEVARGLLKNVPVGVPMDDILTENFELSRAVNLGKLLIGQLISSPLGPEVELPGNIGEEDDVLAVNYINLLTNPYPSNLQALLSRILNLEILDFVSGQELVVKGLENPIKIKFSLKEGEDGEQGICAYYDEETEKFSSDGIGTLEDDVDSYSCTTDHLSQFAILPFVSDDVEEPVVIGEEVKEDEATTGEDNSTKKYIIIAASAGAIILLVSIILALVYYIRKRNVISTLIIL